MSSLLQSNSIFSSENIFRFLEFDNLRFKNLNFGANSTFENSNAPAKSADWSSVDADCLRELISEFSALEIGHDLLLSRFVSNGTNFKFAPICKTPLLLDNVSISPTIHYGMKVPTLFKSLLGSFEKELKQTFYAIAECDVNLAKAQAKFKSGKHFGSLSLPNPGSVGIKNMDDATRSKLTTTLTKLNEDYTKSAYEAVFEAYKATADRLSSGPFLCLKEFSTKLADNIRALLQVMPQNSFSPRLMEHIWGVTLFCAYMYRSYVDLSYDKLNFQILAKESKKIHLQSTIQSVKDDLMDVETNQNTIRSLVIATTKEILESEKVKDSSKTKPKPKAPKAASPNVPKRGSASGAPVKKSTKSAIKTTNGMAPRGFRQGNRQVALKKSAQTTAKRSAIGAPPKKKVSFAK